MIQSIAKHSNELDREWLELITQAYELGISSTEIKEFFKVTCQKEKIIGLPPTYLEGSRMPGRSISH